MKILLCTTTFRNITNGPTKFANLLYQNGNGIYGIEVHILTEDVSEDTERLYKCKLGSIKKLLPLAPVYRMFKYYNKANQLNKLYDFDYILYNNAIYGLIHSLCKQNVVGFINDYNNQKNISGDISIFNYAYIKKTIFKQFERMAISSSKFIIANSDYLTNLLRSAYPKHKEKIIRLYKGLDIVEQLKNDCNWDFEYLKFIQILFVKNDFLTGGLKILADSLSRIDLFFCVTVIGPAIRYSDQISSFFKTPNVSVTLLDQQPQRKIFELMTTHQIFCVPSLQEALGVANLEALQIGIPVVSSDAGGIPEALDYGNCGFLSDAGDAQSLQSSLELCIRNKDLRRKKVVHGFEYVKKFRRELILSNLKMILDERI